MKPILRYGFLALVAAVSFYISLPVFNFGFTGGVFMIFALLLLNLGLRQLSAVKMVATQDGQSFRLDNFNISRFEKIGILLCAIYLFVLPFVLSAPIFHNERYRNLMGTIKKGENFSEHIAPISADQIRTVDEELAYLLGDKVMGSQPALGSQAHIGTFTIQKVNNQLYWVAPLLHSGFFKWLSNGEGTNGYVMVSATNERDVKLVQTFDNQKVSIKYQSAAYFNSYLPRHLYLNGFVTKGLTDYTFEIDDKGKPYWVVTVYDKKVGFQGNDAEGVATVDAASGEVKYYSIAQMPAWIDRVQPADFIAEQLNDWGEYVHGYWNFSNSEKLKTTEHPTLVYGEGNKSYWYTGLTSVGADESTVGFVLVDTRTKQATWYSQSGATEAAAMQSAEGKVQEKRYRAASPTPYNINGVPSYVMALKDNSGLVKMYAMVAINDYTTVGVGNSLQETLFAYKNTFNGNANNSKINTNAASKKLVQEATVERFAQDIKNGTCFYYFTVKGNPKIFVATSQISTKLPLTAHGDLVTIAYDDDTDAVINLNSFDNKSIGGLVVAKDSIR
jgi:hypothetical protein